MMKNETASLYCNKVENILGSDLKMRDKEVLKHFYRSFIVYVKNIYNLIGQEGYIGRFALFNI